MKDIRANLPKRPDMMWDLLIRLSGIALFVILIVAYSTGEEFPHTHVMIGYAIATLLAVGIFWAIVRPHHDRFPSIVYSPSGIKAQLQNADKVPSARLNTDAAYSYDLGLNLVTYFACRFCCDGGHCEQRIRRGSRAENA